MAMTASTNTAANTALRYLNANNATATNSLAKLSSGSRIVKASDDAASLTIGTKLKADVTALKQAQVNAGQAASVIQVADGGMARIGDILQRMKALAVQSSSGSVTNNERAFLNQEFTALRSQVDDIANQTKFNGTVLLAGGAGKTATVGATLATRGISVEVTGNPANASWSLAYATTGVFTLSDGTNNYTTTISTTGLVFDGSIEFADVGLKFNLSNFDDATIMAAAAGTTTTIAGTSALSFQVGAASSESISVSFDDVDATALGVIASTVDTAANAATASTALDTAISRVNDARADMGASLSRFEYVSANLATSVENLEAARSTLMDVDMAAEMSKFSSAQVLMQASVSMLAQANQMPQNLLKLLG